MQMMDANGGYTRNVFGPPLFMLLVNVLSVSLGTSRQIVRDSKLLNFKIMKLFSLSFRLFPILRNWLRVLNQSKTLSRSFNVFY